jgi:hypothetical protein
LKMEDICSSETSVLSRPTSRNVPEDDILDLGKCIRLQNVTGFIFSERSHFSHSAECVS